MTVVIVGGGIAGLSLGLTCHQIGAPFRLFEAAKTIAPLGVGINLQPNAVRELFDLGLEHDLATIGVETREYGFFSKHGREIWTEPRGRFAGYHWPQYSVHRGALQMLLHRRLLERAGAAAVETGWHATGFENLADGAVVHLQAPDGATRSVRGSLVMGADGINSALRAQMEPDEGRPIWAGTLLWRGTTRARPFRTGASIALIGHATQRLVAYPISPPGADGLATINWIAELTDPDARWRKEDWHRAADLADFLPRFAGWRFGWIDAPALIQGAAKVYEYPMVDRDPIARWTRGAVSLIGDAAHPTYPVGSNGASQAIVDARKLGSHLLAHGIGPAALAAYEQEMRPLTTKIVLANRGSGPDAVLQMVEDRCGGAFERIEDVIPRRALARHAARYRKVAGLDIEALNTRPPIIAAGARL